MVWFTPLRTIVNRPGRQFIVPSTILACSQHRTEMQHLFQQRLHPCSTGQRAPTKAVPNFTRVGRNWITAVYVITVSAAVQI